MKTCRKCHESKNTSDFPKDSHKKDGLYTICKDCACKKSKEWAENNIDYVKEYRKQYYKEHAESIKQKSERWRKDNPEWAKQLGREWYLENSDKVKERARLWEKANPSKGCQKTVRRNARKIRAMPHWLTEEQEKEIKVVYDDCPNGYEVDHIMPLKGKGVRGLHVPWNLQHLEASKNHSKGGKYLDQHPSSTHIPYMRMDR